MKSRSFASDRPGIAPSSRVFSNVDLGEAIQIEDHSLIGVPPRNHEDGQLQTIIGNHSLIRSHSVLYAGNRIGSHFQTGHGVVIRELNQIGDHVSVGTQTILEHHLVIANRVRIHSGAFIPEFTVLEEEVWIGPRVVFTNALYPNNAKTKDNLKGVRVLRGAKIGANATLLPGITIGKHALVGAGSVVVQDVEDYQVVVGNPARAIRDVRQISDYELATTLGNS